MYLWRRRAAVFAHGMGIIVSADVARFVAELALEADGLSQAGFCDSRTSEIRVSEHGFKVSCGLGTVECRARRYLISASMQASTESRPGQVHQIRGPSKMHKAN